MIPVMNRSEKNGGSFCFPHGFIRVNWGGFAKDCLDGLKDFTGREVTDQADDAEKSSLTLERDESLAKEAYRLTITPDGLWIAAAEECGVIRAVATICQLMDGTGCLPCMRLTDSPRLAYRGLLLDSARHFIEPAELKKVIDYMMLVKLNALHLHLTDDQGWRIQLQAFPELTKDGDAFYTKAQLQEIVSYAKSRGIEIIPEIDMPGHMSAFLNRYPEYGCGGRPVEAVTAPGIYQNCLCVGEETVYEAVRTILTEIADIFPSKRIHLGGDEVPQGSWDDCEKCRALMEREQPADTKALQAYFTGRVQAIADDLGRQAIFWNDVLTKEQPENAMIQYWSPNGSEEKMQEYAKAGGSFLYSNCYQYYLNYSSCLLPLKKVFAAKPVIGDVPCEDYSGFLGAECALWSEEIDSAEKLESMLFPRLLAFADRCWSGSADYETFEQEAKAFCARYGGSNLTVAPENLWNPEGDVRRAGVMTFLKGMLANRDSKKQEEHASTSIDRSQISRFAKEFLQPEDIPMIMNYLGGNKDKKEEKAEEKAGTDILPGRLHGYEKDHLDTIRECAPQCMVLLKNDKPFTLQRGESLALYGNGARQTQKGGTGSGDVNSFYFPSIEESLEKEGITITTKEWLDGYYSFWKEWQADNIHRVQQELKQRKFEALVFADAGVLEGYHELSITKNADKAVYVLARTMGEGQDRALDGNFRMTEAEIRDVRLLAESYDDFLLVLNTGGVIDLSPVIDCVKNVLLLSQLGAMTGPALADMLLGRTYPSGRLTATWAAERDYYGMEDFGNPDDTEYREGIFTGYRYFEKKRVPVIFPFGYGLMNSTFSVSVRNFSFDAGQVTVTAEVQNTGSNRGRDILQLYVAKPVGRLDQPQKMLVGFAKTEELMPGGQQTLTITCSAYDLASYDPAGKAWVLETGTYRFYLGEDSRTENVCGSGTITEEIHPLPEGTQTDIYEKCRKQAAKVIPQLSDEELALFCLGRFKEGHMINTIGQNSVTVAGAAGETAALDAKYGIPSLVMADGPAGLRLDMQYGRDSEGVYSVTNMQMERYAKYIPAPILTIIRAKRGSVEKRQGKIYDQHCTAIPIGTAIAQSWDVTLAEKLGDLVGDEMERFGVDLWLAPAMNIQRNPLCGRNFEYYSEDPLISGAMAAAICTGVQKHRGKGVTIKHFLGNNQETNRYKSNSVMDERTFREIYLKPFELCIRKAAPHALMTSYNLLNGRHTSEDPVLLQKILREELGYHGLIMSDWVTAGSKSYMTSKYPPAYAVNAIRAGNDLFMPGSREDYDEIMEGLQKGLLTRGELETAAVNNAAVILYLIAKEKKVFCLGDSITFGAGVPLSITTDSYPSVLDRLLGPGYEVRRYGLTGATASRTGDLPYIGSEVYQMAMSEPADVYILMLGTNDVKTYNWNPMEYVKGMVALIGACRNNNPKARILTVLPPMVFPDGGSILYDISAGLLTEKLPVVLKGIAERMQTEFYSLQELTASHPEWFVDGCHPNREGNAMIAAFLKEKILKP